MNSYDNFLDAQWEDHCERQNAADRAAIMADIKAIQLCIDEEVDSWDSLRAEMNSEWCGLAEWIDAKQAIEYGGTLVAEWEVQILELRAEMRAIG
jgi:hypothetical protein